MTDSQIVAMLVAPVMSLVIVITGYVVQNANLNVRVAEMRQDFNARLTSEHDAELRAIRTEMAKNHSELLSVIAKHEHPVSRT